jgi:hypothetical protein
MLSGIALVTFGVVKGRGKEMSGEHHAKTAALQITATQTIDDFEGYHGALPITPWPQCCGYMITPWGDPKAGLQPSLSADVKENGRYGLRLDYDIQPKRGYAMMGHLLNPMLNWSDWDGVRFWLKPDGSGRGISFGFMEQPQADGVKYFWWGDYPTIAGSDKPVWVVVPWSAFRLQATNGATQHVMDRSHVEERIFSVGGKSGPGTMFVDQIQIIKSHNLGKALIALPVR